MKGTFTVTTSVDIDYLKRQRSSALSRAQDIVDTAARAQRDLTDGEDRKYREVMNEARNFERQIELAQEARTYASPGPQAGREDPSARIGMSRREIASYSVVRAIRAQMTNDWRTAGLEREASETEARRLGKGPQGVYVPIDVLEQPTRERRDLSKGTATAGGHTAATDLLGASFIDVLRNAPIVAQAGATILGDLVGDVAIPRQTGAATAYWVPEAGNLTESQEAFDQVTLSPKSVGGFVDMSRKLLLQSSIDVEAFVRRDLAEVLAVEIDRVALHGSGTSNQPTGVASVGGIGSVAGGTNGAVPTWANIVQLETEVAQDNAGMGVLGYVTNAKVRGKLKNVLKVSGGTAPPFIWTDDPATPLNGYPAHVSNQVSSTLTKGTASGICSAIFFGNWADLIIGEWGGLDILVDPYTGGIAGTVRVIAFKDLDVAVRHPESFAAMLDALTT